MQTILSEAPGLGRVTVCGECDEVHVAVGRSAFRLPRDMFQALARMMGEAAAHPALAGASRYAVSFQDGAPVFSPLPE